MPLAPLQSACFTAGALALKIHLREEYPTMYYMQGLQPYEAAAIWAVFVVALIGLARAVAFIMGASFSLTVGQIGMRMAVEGNIRVASASRRSFADALRIAYRAGTITGMLTDGLVLFGGTIIFIKIGRAACRERV